MLPYFVALVVSLEITLKVPTVKVISGVLMINMSSALNSLVHKIGVSSMAYPEGLDSMGLGEEYMQSVLIIQ